MIQFLFLLCTLHIPLKICSFKAPKVNDFGINQVTCMAPLFAPQMAILLQKSLAALPRLLTVVGQRLKLYIIKMEQLRKPYQFFVQKKIKRDKNGSIVKETDTSKPQYQSAKNSFFSPKK